MSLHAELVSTMQAGADHGKFALNVIVKEITEDGPKYYVAECLEIPGCVADGTTPEEASENLASAVRVCLDVILEDCMKQLTACRPLPDLRGIVRQRVMTVGAPTAELMYA